VLCFLCELAAEALKHDAELNVTSHAPRFLLSRRELGKAQGRDRVAEAALQFFEWFAKGPTFIGQHGRQQFDAIAKCSDLEPQTLEKFAIDVLRGQGSPKGQIDPRLEGPSDERRDVLVCSDPPCHALRRGTNCSLELMGIEFVEHASSFVADDLAIRENRFDEELHRHPLTRIRRECMASLQLAMELVEMANMTEYTRQSRQFAHPRAVGFERRFSPPREACRGLEREQLAELDEAPGGSSRFSDRPRIAARRISMTLVEDTFEDGQLVLRVQGEPIGQHRRLPLDVLVRNTWRRYHRWCRIIRSLRRAGATAGAIGAMVDDCGLDVYGLDV